MSKNANFTSQEINLIIIVRIVPGLPGNRNPIGKTEDLILTLGKGTGRVVLQTIEIMMETGEGDRALYLNARTGVELQLEDLFLMTLGTWVPKYMTIILMDIGPGDLQLQLTENHLEGNYGGDHKDHLIKEFARGSLINTMDMTNGSFFIKLEKQDNHKTNFNFQDEILALSRLPQGTCNILAYLSRATKELLHAPDPIKIWIHRFLIDYFERKANISLSLTPPHCQP